MTAMARPLHLHADRLFPTEPLVRALTRQLYDHVADVPIVSPHGHTDRISRHLSSARERCLNDSGLGFHNGGRSE